MRLFCRCKRALSHAGHLVRVFLFQPVCPVCNNPLVHLDENLLCRRCLAELVASADPACPRCACPVSNDGGLCVQCMHAPPPFLETRCVAAYEGIFREVILRYKYGGVVGLAKPLSRCLPPPDFQNLGAESQILVTVPDDPGRKRAFSPMQEIARRYARLHHIPFRPKALAKVRSTPPQAGLSLSARKRNLAGSFRCRGKYVRDRDVVLMDDVFTTGSTLNACARELGRAGARVRVIALARTP
ncbi:MAG TPA: ComF family protein [Candidatus Aminicenantes bacterium]|mgnify:CR=1 FL=1|nr:ComF family protein [Candidatus Aminicenantes bacterium]